MRPHGLLPLQRWGSKRGRAKGRKGNKLEITEGATTTSKALLFSQIFTFVPLLVLYGELSQHGRVAVGGTALHTRRPDEF